MGSVPRINHLLATFSQTNPRFQKRHCALFWDYLATNMTRIGPPRVLNTPILIRLEILVYEFFHKRLSTNKIN